MATSPVRRKSRPDQHRTENDALAREYGTTLRRIVGDFAVEPAPAATAYYHVLRMQQVAEGLYAAAFRRGLAQAAGSLGRFTVRERLAVDGHLDHNRRYLFGSLHPDLVHLVARKRLHADLTAVGRRLIVDRSVGARVENLYGGHLWTVQEDGFRHGALQLDTFLRRGLPGSLTQEALVLPRSEAYDVEREHLLGWSDVRIVADLLGIDEEQMAEEWDATSVGCSYVTAADGDVCEGCDAAGGDYFPASSCPLPGTVCKGKTNCRCHLQLVSRRTTT